MNSACHLASMLPRVPIRMGFTGAPGLAEKVREWLRPAEFCGEDLFPLADGAQDRAAFFPGVRRSAIRLVRAARRYGRGRVRRVREQKQPVLPSICGGELRRCR